MEHDLQLYRAYERAEARLLGRDAHIQRVVLGHELKSGYQRWRHERDKDHDDYDGYPDRTPDEIREWAHEHDLPYFDDEVHFPDVRMEYRQGAETLIRPTGSSRFRATVSSSRWTNGITTERIWFRSSWRAIPISSRAIRWTLRFPRRWLLIGREFQIPDEDRGTARWSLDHLIVDQDGTPTLILHFLGLAMDSRRPSATS